MTQRSKPPSRFSDVRERIIPAAVQVLKSSRIGFAMHFVAAIKKVRPFSATTPSLQKAVCLHCFHADAKFLGQLVACQPAECSKSSGAMLMGCWRNLPCFPFGPRAYWA